MSKEVIAKIIDDLDFIINEYEIGHLNFSSFIDKYGYPIGEYALDGHESDQDGKNILQSLSDRLAIHFEIQDKILHTISPESNHPYRISYAEGEEILKGVLASHASKNT